MQNLHLLPPAAHLVHSGEAQAAGLGPGEGEGLGLGLGVPGLHIMGCTTPLVSLPQMGWTQLACLHCWRVRLCQVRCASVQHWQAAGCTRQPHKEWAGCSAQLT